MNTRAPAAFLDFGILSGVEAQTAPFLASHAVAQSIIPGMARHFGSVRAASAKLKPDCQRAMREKPRASILRIKTQIVQRLQEAIMENRRARIRETGECQIQRRTRFL